MYSNSKIAKAVRLAMIFGASAAVAVSAPAFSAEEAAEKIERIEVTGSSIKRTDMEGSLPVTVISKAQIDASGVINVAELVAQIPAMQGYTTASDSVGGGGGGVQSASLHNIGSQYTLVLLNGRRMAPSDSGSTIDLSNIPLALIERVEVLTDGASALYGSDAIAGVLNFILKDEVEGTTVSARYSSPQHKGGKDWNFDITTGFGNFDNDGYSVALSYSHQRKDQLASKDRDFAKSGIINFNHSSYSQDLLFFNGSGNGIPGNARVRWLDENGDRQQWTFNPYKEANGSCDVNTSPIGDECWFDYTSTIEILPESDRDTVYANVNVAITDDIKGFVTASFSNYEMVTRIAPYPTGFFRLPNDAQVVIDNVLPHLNQDQIDNLVSVDGRWRALPASNRTTSWDTDSVNLVAGLEGSVGDIDFSGAIVHSVNDTAQGYDDGWLLADPFFDAAQSGAFNIFASASSFTDEDAAVVRSTVYNGPWDRTKISMQGIDGKASMPVFDMSGGQAYIAAGFDYRTTSYERTISQANADEVILFNSADTPFDMERSQYGVFAEILMPVTDNFEVNASFRYDDIGAVEDKINGGDINKSDDDTTYKVSANWKVSDDFSLRASYGTGFKAASMRQIGEPRVDFGVTSGNFECPFPTSDAEFGAMCLPGRSQYQVWREGAADLKSETSKQTTVGLVYAPSTHLGFTLDYWKVELANLVERLTEPQIFADPVKYRHLFTTKLNTGTNENELAIIQAAVNGGTGDYSGLDYSFRILNDLSFGSLTTEFSGTYMIESLSSLTGSSLGKFGQDQQVAFRNIVQIKNTLAHGDFAHTLTLNYRSGYLDEQQIDTCAVNIIEDDGSIGDCAPLQLTVPSYTKIDFQTRYSGVENLNISFGINNIFDKEPPFSLRTGGAGHQVGWDPRYADAYGRTFYIQADYTF